MNPLTDIAITAALVFGFALACVIAVVYLLSKRQITVNQVNHNEPRINVGSAVDTSGSGKLERAVIKWVALLLVGGILIAAAANALNSIGTAITAATQTAAPVAPPVSQPVAPRITTATAPQAAPQAAPTSATEVLMIVIGLLIMANLGMWGYAAYYGLKRRQRQPAIAQAKREQQLERMLDNLNI